MVEFGSKYYGSDVLAADGSSWDRSPGQSRGRAPIRPAQLAAKSAHAPDLKPNRAPRTNLVRNLDKPCTISSVCTPATAQHEPLLPRERQGLCRDLRPRSVSPFSCSPSATVRLTRVPLLRIGNLRTAALVRSNYTCLGRLLTFEFRSASMDRVSVQTDPPRGKGAYSSP